MNDRFPEVWVPSSSENDLRQLLWHRQKFVWIRASVKNQLHALAMGQGACRKAKLWNSKGREDVRRLMTHPGVGRIVALAFVLTVGPVDRFPGSKQLVSYLGLNPRERSTGGRQRFGAISKQGNRLMRTLLVEAAQTAARVEPTWRRHYQRLKFRKASAVAKVAIARKLAVRLYWMLRSKVDYAELVRMQGSSGANLVDLHPSID
jgi:transposase